MIPFVVIGMLALFGLAALATDVGHVWAARSELQAAADAAAMAAAVAMVDSTNTAVTLANARSAANDLGTANRADQNVVNIPASNLSFGTWSLPDGPLVAPVPAGDPNAYTAVRVQANLSLSENGAVETVLAAVFGRDEFEIGAESTAYLGFAGSFPRDQVEVPIGIDCCSITQGGSDCGLGGGTGVFTCDGITSPPLNQCELEDTVTQVSCLDFELPSPNACWSEFRTSSSSITVSGLQNVVRNGPSESLSHEDPVFVDNGTYAGAVLKVWDKFVGAGPFAGNPAGVDHHPTVFGAGPSPGPGEPDSWVVTLPVFDCQSQNRCSGGSQARIVGAVCFEIREVDTGADVIKGNFICDPSDPLFTQCQVPGAGPGGGNFGGVRATRALLVR